MAEEVSNFKHFFTYFDRKGEQITSVIIRKCCKVEDLLLLGRVLLPPKSFDELFLGVLFVILVKAQNHKELIQCN